MNNTIKKTLISFIGKGKFTESGYARVRYSMNGQTSDEVTFICKSLYDFLKPHKILIIGTSGSTWSEVFTNFLSEEQQNRHVTLKSELEVLQYSSAERDAFGNCIQKLSDVISNELNVEFVCRIYDENSENELFTTIINNIDSGEEITLDVTHGFRFTPMCALMAIQYLSYIKKSKIKHIYYGWFENKLDVKPIKDLSWIIKLNKWTTAFAEYGKTNDISCFSSLFTDKTLIKNIDSASFNEKITYASDSIDILKNIDLSSITESDDPVLRSFAKPLEEKLSYAHSELPSKSIFLLSQQYLKSNDFLRTIIYLHETFMVRYSEIGILKFDLRKNTTWSPEQQSRILSQLSAVNSDLDKVKKLKSKQIESIKDIQISINVFINNVNNHKSDNNPWTTCFDIYDRIAKFYMKNKYWNIFSTLNQLRNAVAHGTPTAEIKNLFYKNKASMRDRLRNLSNDIENTLWNDCSNQVK